MKPTHPRRRRWLRPAIALAATLLTLVSLEALSYLFGVFEGPLQPLRVGNIQLYGQHDPLLFWSLKPGAQSGDAQIWINQRGLRGPEIGPKQPGEFRILSLGESTTFAAQMPYADSYSAQLETRLADGRPGGRVRVLNAGVPGYSLFQGAVYLENRSRFVKPDMVLFYFGYNDFLPVAYLAERVGDAAGSPQGRDDWELFQHRQTRFQRFAARLIRHSNLIRGLAGMVRPSSGSLASAQRPRVPDAIRSELLQLIKQYTDRKGIELVLVIPIYRDFELHADVLRKFAEQESVRIVDLPRLFSERGLAPREDYFLDAVHPTPQGHRFIANAIFDAVDAHVPR